jgi:O-antigen ligase
MALTYSRSSLLAFIVVLLIYCLKNKAYPLLLGGILLVILTIIALPKSVGEGTNLSRTSTISAKIENYKEALDFIYHKPLLGYGYNFLLQQRPDMDHAASGFDSSLLTIATTSGLIGFACFLWAIKGQFDYYLLAVAIHSLFSNSLLYPWVFFLFFSLRLRYRK